MFILKILFIFFISLNISSSYASNIKNSAVVFMYHKFGVSKYPSTSVTIDQLNSHIEELTKEKYTIKSLDFIVDTIINDGDLPANTIGISVDDADKSFLEVGWPLFKENNIPVTLFVTTGTISNNKKYINWDQIRKLKEEGVVIGAHSHTHAHMPDISIEEVRNEIETSNLYYLPRFSLNQRYGEIDRVKFAANAKGLGIYDFIPTDPSIKDNPPFIGFSLLDEKLAPSLDCFIFDSKGQVEKEIFKFNERIEIRLQRKLTKGRSRVNCTAKGKDGFWRWFGHQFYL